MLPKREFGKEMLNMTVFPSLTYSMDLDGVNINSYKDDLKAVEQAIYKMIYTERYKHLIYTWNYGIELKDLFGKTIPYCCVEIERRIKECLISDDRITRVFNFDFKEPNFGSIICFFEVETIYGNAKIEGGFKLK